MTEYIVCPYCGKKIQDFTFAKVLRNSIGFIEELGRDVGPILGGIVGKTSGIFGASTVGKKLMKKAVGSHGDPLVSKTIHCPHCKKAFQAD